MLKRISEISAYIEKLVEVYYDCDILRKTTLPPQDSIEFLVDWPDEGWREGFLSLLSLGKDIKFRY